MKQKFLGCFSRRERWGLSRRGWLALLALALLVFFLGLHRVHPFLAPTQRAETKVLVMEGWIHEYAVRAVVAEFQTGHYEKIYTTGGPVIGTDGATNVFNTSASVGAERLVSAGVPADKVQMVPAHVVGRDRTFNSARALRDWFRAHGETATTINVVTEDVHARRTWLLFQRAFGDGLKVGVVAIPNPDYEPAHWWRYSEGVREILGESIAYGYAKFIFSPEPEAPQVP
ncbi:MAG: hypothetical protein RL616_2548 [Verrucomicrobiota bacterium]